MPVVIIQRRCSDTVAAQRRCIQKCSFFLPRGEKLVWRFVSLQFISHISYHQSFATIGGGHSLKWDDLCRAKIKIASWWGEWGNKLLSWTCEDSESALILQIETSGVFGPYRWGMGMQLPSGAEHFGNIINVMWITVLSICQIGA
jgi:hypothetical protein